MLTVTPQVLAEIVAHARRDAPIEACGYLAECDGVTSRSFSLTNGDASPEHYTLVPAEQFAALRAMRRDGFQLRAVYHSHPTSPARMSAEDIRLAADPSLSYVIVALASGEPVVKSFRVGQGVREEPIILSATVRAREAG